MRVFITNDKQNAIFVGSTMIPPGETKDFDIREVPDNLLPAHLRSKAEEPQEPQTKPDPLAALVARPAKEVIAALPLLSDEDLGKLEELEKARATDDKKGTEPRKTVLEAIAEETLKRAGDPDKTQPGSTGTEEPRE